MGKLAGYNHNTWELSFPDQAGDDVLAIGRAPFGGATIKGAWAICDTTLAGGTANVITLNLYDGGQVGTATTAIGTAGGTTGWTADTAETFSLNADLDELDAGDWLMLNYDETGTVAPLFTRVVVEWVNGKG